jgi:hypothetical protein
MVFQDHNNISIELMNRAQYFQMHRPAPEIVIPKLIAEITVDLGTTEISHDEIIGLYRITGEDYR